MQKCPLHSLIYSFCVLLILGLSPLFTGCAVLRRNDSPVLDFVVVPEEGDLGREMLFDASLSFDPDGTIVAYDWDFSDQSWASGILVTHVYAAPGEYKVRLIVRDNQGAVASADKTVTVKTPGEPSKSLVGRFNFPAEIVASFVNLTFDASPSYCRDAEILYYFWDFGDGKEDEGKVVR